MISSSPPALLLVYLQSNRMTPPCPLLVQNPPNLPLHPPNQICLPPLHPLQQVHHRFQLRIPSPWSLSQYLRSRQRNPDHPSSLRQQRAFLQLLKRKQSSLLFQASQRGKSWNLVLPELKPTGFDFSAEYDYSCKRPEERVLASPPCFYQRGWVVLFIALTACQTSGRGKLCLWSEIWLCP